METLFQIIRRSLLGTLALLVVGGIVAILYLESTLPSVDMLKDMRLAVPLKIYANDGKLISEFGEERRTPIPLAQVPKDLIHAVLATEDRRFYEHPGVDFRGLLRAGVSLLTNSSIKQGGSTITMQVARNFFLTRQKTFIRKLSEILLALKIEKGLTKDEILELYLNKIYFGKRAYGIASAAAVYYGTTVDKLSLDQIAMLAGLPQAPSSINPLHDPDAAFKRRKHVLERMLSYDFITPDQFKAAVDAPLPTKSHTHAAEIEAPYVAEMVRQDLYARYGDAIYTLGYEVYTTIDSQQQLAANLALKKALLKYDQRHGYRKTQIHFKLTRNKTPEQELDNWTQELRDIPAYNDILPGVVMHVSNTNISVLLQDGRHIEIPWAGLSWARPQLKGARVGASPKKPSDVVTVGDVIYTEATQDQTWKMVQIPEVGGAIVALAPDTGSILAMVGGFDYRLSSFNRVTQAERQPGSGFKPFLWAAALAEGYTLATKINDAPLVFTDPVSGVVWRPHNATNKFYGPTSLRKSLARSQNMVAIRLLQAVGIKKFLEFSENFGFNPEKFPPYLPLALGAGELTPLDVAAGYCVFANGGNRVTPNLITKIKDYQGNLVYEAPPPTSTVTIGPQIAYLMTAALQDNIQSSFGTGQRAKSLGRNDIVGKTGTTNEWFDAWYSGFNRDVVVTTWVGFDDPRTLGEKEFGGVVALPMWISFMEAVLKDKPERPLEPPPGIVSVKIDPNTGLLAHEDQSGAVAEFFTEDTLPTERGSSLGMFDEEDGGNGGSYGTSVEALF
ncbi:MAG TPA: penicillin-binding protein 1A [Gammaproteobacteria bacterium]|nr:penicillin-binding protein 1A [Gammaproteobacteria bacterium]